MKKMSQEGKLLLCLVLVFVSSVLVMLGCAIGSYLLENTKTQISPDLPGVAPVDVYISRVKIGIPSVKTEYTVNLSEGVEQLELTKSFFLYNDYYLAERYAGVGIVRIQSEKYFLIYSVETGTWKTGNRGGYSGREVFLSSDNQFVKQEVAKAEKLFNDACQKLSVKKIIAKTGALGAEDEGVNT